jgi:hypothetical protein
MKNPSIVSPKTAAYRFGLNRSNEVGEYLEGRGVWVCSPVALPPLSWSLVLPCNRFRAWHVVRG